MDLKIGVILGTTRPNRTGPKIAKWFMEAMKNQQDLEFELIDLAEVNLPLFDEPVPPMAGNYQNEHTKKWAKQIAQYDGFVFITAEYNHGYPASLKNAIDYLYQEWVHKPVAFVSYGSIAGGARAVEQLRQVVINLEMAPLNAHILVPQIWNAFDEKDTLRPESIQGKPEALADSLRWWGQALKAARQQ